MIILSKMHNFRFKELPVEIQSKILRSDRLLKPASLRINKSIYNESISQMYHDEGNREITLKEVKHYKKNYKPLLLGKFYFDKINKWRYIAYIYNDYQIIEPFIVVHPIGQETGELVVGKVNIDYVRHYYNTMLEKNRRKPIGYDLLTMYYIYSNRISCMNINPNYAKEKVLSYFDDELSVLSGEDLLIFLRVNARIMGIYTKGYADFYQTQYHIFIRDNVVDNKIQEEVNLLEKLVLKKINNL
jgi:hypothetical protein